MNFEQFVDITPEEICDIYKIDIHDFLDLVEGKKTIVNEKTILFVIEEYIKTLKLNRSKSKLTIKYYITILCSFGKFITARKANSYISEITEELFIEFTYTCRPVKGDKLSARTYNTYLAIISNLMEFAITLKYMSSDDRKKIDKIRSEILPRYLSDELVPRVLLEAKKTSWPFLNFALIYFMLGTGCRVSEVSNMRICDFRINEDLIFVREGKGQKERYIPMYPQVRKVIMDYLARTGIYVWDIRDQSYLFSKRCYDVRESIKVRNIQYMVSSIYKKLNIEGIFTVHSLRHTFAYNAMAVGMAIYDLQEILGHNSIETTRVYTKRRPADLRNAVQSYPFPLEKLVAHVIGIGDGSNN